MQKLYLEKFLMLAVILLMSACVANQSHLTDIDPIPAEDSNLPEKVSDPLPVDELTEPLDPADQSLPPQAAVIARELLAVQIDPSVDKIMIISFVQADWADSCLGLGGPAESCLAVITSGWQVTLLVDDQHYIARTDSLGDSVRFEGDELTYPVVPPPPTGSDGSVSEAAIKAREILADRLGIAFEEITIVSVEHTEWPDGCLGLPQKGFMCTMAIVPGWRVELSADGQSFIARTDETGNMIKFE